MRYVLIALSMLFLPLSPAFGQLSISFDTPGMSIGINLPVYPTLQRIPGYPVYYAPGLNDNYFFYDGLYWVFQRDNWYASSWYNGPWALVDPQDVPVFLLRVPVRYYREAPTYFRGWNAQEPPRWGEHWGQSWEQRHSDWDRWDRRSAPAPAPLPTYQRQYTGSRYPQGSEQAVLQTRNYRFQPKDPVAQQHFQQMRTQAGSAPPLQPVQRSQPSRPQQAPVAREQPAPRPAPQQAERKPQQVPVAREQQAPRQPPQQAERKPQQVPAAREQQAPRQAPQQAERKPPQAPAAHEQQAPRPQAQEKAPQGREHGNEQGKGQGGEKDNKENKDNR
ncbi:MAG TPA: hypothetical protein VN598_12890 [Usitatibacter sp.]|nr:hypothetical protein [Usitatibacter sp.]